jgi:ABC-type sugar transport system permease subunit
MKTRRLSRDNRNRLTALGFLAPNLLGFLVFTLIPIGIGIGMSFFRWDGANEPVFIGLRNFARLFTDSKFGNAMRVTLLYTLLTVPVTIVLSLFIASLLTAKIRLTSAFRSVFFFPYIASIVAVAIVWQFLYHAELGPINEFLRAIGIAEPPRWTSSKDTAIYAVAIMSIWRSVGYYMVLFIAGLVGIPPSLYEAGAIDGANSWQKFWHITLPMLSPTTFFVVIISIINSFQAFTPIYIMTGGGPGTATQVLVFRIYEEAFVLSGFGYASAMALALLLMVLVFTVFQFRWQEKNVAYMQ